MPWKMPKPARNFTQQKALFGLFLFVRSKSHFNSYRMLQATLRTAQNLSLDVVLGAVISSMFIARLLSVSLSLVDLTALGLAVWLIYTADHLTDAMKIPHAAHTTRHRYHQQYFRPLLIGWILLAMGGVLLLSQLSWILVLKGLVMVTFVGVYFMLIHILPRITFFHKELMIAILYTGGVFLAPVHMYTNAFDRTLILLCGQYFMLALVNVFIISWYEQDSDQKDGHHSYIIALGPAKGVKVIRIALGVLFASIAFGVVFFRINQAFMGVQFTLLLMTTTLHAVLHFPRYFIRRRRYRAWSDAVFSYPLVYLLMS